MATQARVRPSGENSGAASQASLASVRQRAGAEPSVGTAHKSQSVDHTSSEPTTTLAA